MQIENFEKEEQCTEIQVLQGLFYYSRLRITTESSGYTTSSSGHFARKRPARVYLCIVFKKGHYIYGNQNDRR